MDQALQIEARRLTSLENGALDIGRKKGKLDERTVVSTWLGTSGFGMRSGGRIKW